MPEVLRYLCPFCEREVRVGEPCPGCAKKAVKKIRSEKSWEQPKSLDGLDLPEDDFDYEEFCKNEFGKSPHRRTGLKWYWWLLAIGILIGMAASSFWIR
jgi:hypothetical protein